MSVTEKSIIERRSTVKGMTVERDEKNKWEYIV